MSALNKTHSIGPKKLMTTKLVLVEFAYGMLMV